MVLWIGFDLQAEIEAVGANNCTALHLAASFGKEAVAAQLLQAGASVSAVTDGGQTPLHVAALVRIGYTQNSFSILRRILSRLFLFFTYKTLV